MISSTWQTFRGNFKEIMAIIKPVLVISLIMVVLKFVNAYLTDAKILTTSAALISTVAVGLVSIVLSIVSGLIYAPAALRTFQKKEFGEVTTLAENVAFTKTHKWEFFCVMFWAGLLTLIYMIGSILPAIAGIWIAAMMKDTNLVVGIIIGVVGAAVSVYFLFKNIAKFAFPLNAYFLNGEGKDYRESAKESIRLGTVYRSDVYALFGRLIVVNILLFIVGAVIMGLALLPEYIAFFSGEVNTVTLEMSQSTEWRIFIVSILTTIVDVCITFPLTAMLTAKAFVAIKAKDTASTPVVAEVVETSVEPETV